MLAVIGGSGLYDLEGMKITEEKYVETPFGQTSSPVIQGNYEGRDLLFLSRHGRGHALLPHEINFRANIFALKKMGATSLVSVSAVGSLREEIAPGDLCIVSQYIDYTKKRESSFFGKSLVAHVSTAKPACSLLAQQIGLAAEREGLQIHRDKTYICIEGPRLGTRAESFMFRNFGADLVGMTNVPEAFLAKEAQIAYCSLAVATDYDCWRDEESEFVSVAQVMERFGESIGKTKKLLGALFQLNWDDSHSEFRTALKTSILTPESHWDSSAKELMVVLGR